MGAEEADWLSYRYAYGAAWRFVESLQYREPAHMVDTDDVALRARVLKAVRDELGEVFDSIDADTVREAVADALHDRRPRC